MDEIVRRAIEEADRVRHQSASDDELFERAAACRRRCQLLYKTFNLPPVEPPQQTAAMGEETTVGWNDWFEKGFKNHLTPVIEAIGEETGIMHRALREQLRAEFRQELAELRRELLGTPSGKIVDLPKFIENRKRSDAA